MEKAKYNSVDKAAHKLYLNNYFVSQFSFYIEKLLYGKQFSKIKSEENVFVTGLARCGTTSLFNQIYQSGFFAALKYADMPFLLMPTLWSRLHKIQSNSSVMRMHDDGILITENSPEEFDEYFWKVITNNSFITKDSLEIHQVSAEQMKQYHWYMKDVCFLNKKERYLSKNNNLVLRLSFLLDYFPASKFFVLFRNPYDHAASLLRQHQQFSKLQQEDSFMTSYFDFLGHYEFGLNQKPFHLISSNTAGIQSTDKNTLEYWLLCWKQYYQYMLENFKEKVIWISFEGLCKNPTDINRYIAGILNYNTDGKSLSGHTPRVYNYPVSDTRLLDECVGVYNQLLSSISY